MRASRLVNAVVVFVSLAIPAAIAWHYSDRILGPDSPHTLREQRVLGTDPGRIRLSRDRESLQPGTWALQWEDGYGWVDAVLSADRSSVERVFRPVVGRPPVEGWASLRGVSRSAEPRSMLGLAYSTVRIAGPLGDYPAWFVPGHESTWVIYVHGRAANRAEGLRTLGVLARRGMPGLLITYRNDLEAPRSPDGRYHLGQTEWQDLEAAVRFALDHRARDVVIAGYSMGGQIALQFMAHSPLASHVRGLLLESPVLDWNAVIMHRARLTHVPAFAAWLGERVATMRAGLDWSDLDRVAHASGITTPILLFHCVHDSFAPVSRSESFARSLPGCVTFVRIEGGNHVDAWNADPDHYAVTLEAWVEGRELARSPE